MKITSLNVSFRPSLRALVAVLGVVALGIVILVKTAIIVPQQSAYVVERLGKFSRKLDAGFHILVPFLERVAY